MTRDPESLWDTLGALQALNQILLECPFLVCKGGQMKIEEKKKLLEDYLSKCPFIEFHSIVELNAETATIDVAFDHELEEKDEILVS